MDASKRQKMMKEVELEMESVDDAIKQVMGIRSSFEERSSNLKTEIRSSFASHLEHLRYREEQLLRQVDVLTKNQMALLHTQIAKLYHLLGRLQMALENVTSDEFDLDSCFGLLKEMESVKKIQSQKIPSFSLNLDYNILVNSIQEFGRLDIMGSLLNFPPPEGSKSLPSSVEEYELESHDHHVMHKTLQDETSVVQIRTPTKIPSEMQQWLSSKETKKQDDNPLFHWVQKQTPSVFDKNTKHLHKWLKQIRDADESEPENLESSFQMIGLEDRNSTGSDSIEKLSQVSSRYEIVFPSTPPQSLTTEWLSKSYGESDTCECASEIENLNISTNGWCSNQSSCELSCKNKWLSQGTIKYDEESALPNIDTTCRANEVCSSYNDCLFSQNCAIEWLKQMREEESNALSWILKESKEDQQKAVLEPMMKILKARKEDYLMDKGKIEMEVDGDKKSWLQEKNENICQSPLGKLGNGIRMQISEMFKVYFEPMEKSKWLSALH